MHASNRALPATSLAAALVLLAAGCANVDPDHFLPPAAAAAAAAQRLDGSVDVQAYAPARTRGSQVLDKWGEPESVNSPGGRVSLYPGATLRAALEKAVVRQGLFARTAGSGADYVLDVWVIDAVRTTGTPGESGGINLTALWRLTRVRDGAVVWADFAGGRGAARRTGADAAVQPIEEATQAMIADGLAKLARRSESPVAARTAADWPSKAPETPARLRAMRECWSKLREGTAIAEVRQLLVPTFEIMPIASGHDVHYSAGGGTGWILDARQARVFEPLFPFYTLYFVNGRLQRMEMHF